MKTEEAVPESGMRSPSLKDLAAGGEGGHCQSGKRSYEYDRLRGKPSKDAGQQQNRMWFDDLPPHTD